MNNSKPIIFMIAIGAVVIGVLSFIPYTLALYPRPAVLRETQTVVLSSLERDAVKPAAPDFDVADWYAAHNEIPEDHGVLIQSRDGSRTFASHNADIAFNPASLMKLVTSLVALKRLGPDYRFSTVVSSDGAVDRSGTLHGTLRVTGDDPTFGDVAASMIARELRARGIKRITDGITVSTDFSFNFSESADDSGSRFSRALALGKPRINVSDEKTGDEMFAVNSYPLRDILLYMNAHSSNFIAERIGSMLGGPAGVEQFLVDDLRLPGAEVTVDRTSGRGHNRLTPRGLVTVIRALSDEIEKDGMALDQVMAVASEDVGTLRRRLSGTGLEGAVVAKTGTLTTEVDGGMASLAGFVNTQSNGTIMFAILDRGNHVSEHRQMEDQLLTDVVRANDIPSAIPFHALRQFLPASELEVVSRNSPPQTPEKSRPRSSVD